MQSNSEQEANENRLALSADNH